MSQSLPSTLGALKQSPYGAERLRGRSVRDEIRANLLARIAEGKPLFRGVLGYEDTVMPQIVNALLSKHHFILLGLRGQAKSRILRALTTLLDPALPVIAGSETNADPFAPISNSNPLLQAVSLETLHIACVVAGVLGVAVLWLRQRRRLRGD